MGDSFKIIFDPQNPEMYHMRSDSFQFQSITIKCFVFGFIIWSLVFVIGVGVGEYAFKWYDVMINLFIIPPPSVIIIWLLLYYCCHAFHEKIVPNFVKYVPRNELELDPKDRMLPRYSLLQVTL